MVNLWKQLIHCYRCEHIHLCLIFLISSPRHTSSETYLITATHHIFLESYAALSQDERRKPIRKAIVSNMDPRLCTSNPQETAYANIWFLPGLVAHQIEQSPTSGVGGGDRIHQSEALFISPQATA